MSLNLPFRTI